MFVLLECCVTILRFESEKKKRLQKLKEMDNLEVGHNLLRSSTGVSPPSTPIRVKRRDEISSEESLPLSAAKKVSVSRQKYLKKRKYLNLSTEKYLKFKERSLKERSKLGLGQSEKMLELYTYWSQLLRKKFNKGIYMEFKKMAKEDALFGYRFGIECLFNFYKIGLLRNFEKDRHLDIYHIIYQDFQSETLVDCDLNQLYGLDTFWTFLEKHQDSSSLQVDDRIKEKLQQYKPIEELIKFPTILGCETKGEAKRKLLRLRTKSENLSKKSNFGHNNFLNERKRQTYQVPKKTNYKKCRVAKVLITENDVKEKSNISNDSLSENCKSNSLAAAVYATSSCLYMLKLLKTAPCDCKEC